MGLNRYTFILFVMIANLALFLPGPILWALACKQHQTGQRSLPTATRDQRSGDAAGENVTDKNHYIMAAKRLARQHNLTERPEKCLAFAVRDELHGGKVIVEVRERHNDICSGDPNTAPRLYSMGFDNADGTVWCDAKSPTGEMEPISDR